MQTLCGWQWVNKFNWQIDLNKMLHVRTLSYVKLHMGFHLNNECYFNLPVLVFPMHRLADEMPNCRAELNGMGSHCKMVKILVVALEAMVF